MAIGNVQIATNRYAPTGSDAINLYSYDYASNLTLGQLVQAVCLRSAATYERQSVMKMNVMASGSQTLDEAADWLKRIAEGTANWTDAKSFLVSRMGIDANVLPDALEKTPTDQRCSYDKRMQAAKALQDKMNLLAQRQQEDMIDLQTYESRRDVVYSTATNIVKNTGMTKQMTVANLR